MVIQRAIEILLIVVILIGSALMWQSTAIRRGLTREHERLVAKVGRLPIKDPTKVHIVAIKTDDPSHFAWRAYFPPNYHYSYSCTSGGGSGSMSSAWEGVLRVRVREVNGQLQLYYSFFQGSGLRSFGPGELVEIFKERPNELGKLKVQQLAANGLEIFDPSEIKTLIKLSLRDELLSEAKRRMKDWEYRNVAPQLEWIRLGPPGFPERETADPKDQ